MRGNDEECGLAWTNGIRGVCVGLLVSCATAAGAAPSRPAAPPRAAVEAVRLRFPERFVDPSSWAMGDLDGDGIVDLAAVLGDPMRNNPDKIPQVAVFRGKPDGRFSFAGVTQDLPIDGGCFESVSIKGQMLMLDRDGASGYSRRWHETFKFMWRDGHLRLVGLEVADGINDGPRDDHGESVNVLTGDIVDWRVKGPRRSETRRHRRPVLVDFDRFDYGRVMEALGPFP
ncbi:MAG: hypothetical protein ABIR54_20545 [Burkholderiaceae bacterium]|jgi:hypothetical protein